MRDLVMQFSDGLAAFEVSPEGLVKPLYASDNVCGFFGYTKEEWLPLTECFTPLDRCRIVSICIFGYFDVFVDGNPIAFRNKKAKELLALLVDHKGGYVTSGEAISFLWEDEPANALTLSRYRKVALRLKSTLEEYGVSDVVAAVGGKRRIVLDKVECDLYKYLSSKEEYTQLFKGSYLTNYSWGETTLGELVNNRK